METQASSRQLRQSTLLAIVTTTVAAGSLILFGCTPGGAPSNGPTPTPTLSIAQSPIMNGYNATRDQALMTIEVLTSSPAPQSGYSSAPFEIDQDRLATAAGWAESEVANENCTIPNATIARDGVGAKADDSTCEVTGGQWFDPLTGKTVTRGSVSARPFLPTERAWSSGANAWTDYQFSIYRNSPQSVMAISDEAYEERGQHGPDRWRPEDKGLWCGYALRWVSEKNTYGLALESQAEGAALTEMLNTCPDQGFANPTA